MRKTLPASPHSDAPLVLEFRGTGQLGSPSSQEAPEAVERFVAQVRSIVSDLSAIRPRLAAARGEDDAETKAMKRGISDRIHVAALGLRRLSHPGTLGPSEGAPTPSTYGSVSALGAYEAVQVEALLLRKAPRENWYRAAIEAHDGRLSLAQGIFAASLRASLCEKSLTVEELRAALSTQFPGCDVTFEVPPQDAGRVLTAKPADVFALLLLLYEDYEVNGSRQRRPACRISAGATSWSLEFRSPPGPLPRKELLARRYLERVLADMGGRLAFSQPENGAWATLCHFAFPPERVGTRRVIRPPSDRFPTP